MNQREAFRETLELARSHNMDNCSSGIFELDYPHLASMYQRILEADYTTEPFSETKIGRWLGWAQAAVVSNGCGSLEEMKQINKRWAE